MSFALDLRLAFLSVFLPETGYLTHPRAMHYILNPDCFRMAARGCSQCWDFYFPRVGVPAGALLSADGQVVSQLFQPLGRVQLAILMLEPNQMKGQ